MSMPVVPPHVPITLRFEHQRFGPVSRCIYCGTDGDVVILEAGDTSGLGVVFQGTMTRAWADFSAMPDVCFHASAHAGVLQALKPIPPSSYIGSVDVATVMAGLAVQMGLTFENTGVSVKLANPYFPGTAWEQADRAATAAGINWVADKTKLAIWPKGQPRGSQIPLVSPDTGLIGYPLFNSKGIIVTTQYNPSINFGSAIQVQSSLGPANGKWFVSAISHELESEIPNGNWFSRIEAVPPGYSGFGGQL
jgi:hypothetical protein